MKRINSVEELIKFEEKRQLQAVKDGVVEESDAKAWLSGFEEAIRDYWKDNNINMMMVLEIDELEDEEYALASFGDDDGTFKMVYMSCRYDMVRFFVQVKF